MRPASTFPPSSRSSPVGAVAVSPSGTRLYVVAPAAGALAEIDTAALRVTRTAQLPEPSTETTVRATVAGSTTLYVAMAGEVTAVDLADLTASDEWYVPGTVTGIQPSTSSRTLFVSLADRVLAVDPATGATQRELTSDQCRPDRPRRARAAPDRRGERLRRPVRLLSGRVRVTAHRQ